MTRAIFAILVLGVLVVCWWSYRREQDSGTSVNAIRERSAPLHATCTSPEIKDAANQREATWKCDTEISWKEYSTWIGTRLGSDFKLKPTNDGSLWFGKLGSADAFELRVTGNTIGRLQLVFYYREYAD